MKSIGFDNKKGAYETQDYALGQGYKCRLSVKETEGGKLYFVWVDDLTIEQSERVNDFARKIKGLLWLSTLKKDYESANRAYNRFYS